MPLQLKNVGVSGERRRLRLPQSVALGVIQRTGRRFDAVQLTNLSDEPDRFSERFLQCLVEVPSGVRIILSTR